MTKANATLFSDVVRIERGDFLLFRCEMLSNGQQDVNRFFTGCYYPRWHGFYLEEVRSIIGNLGYTELKHFPAYPFDVYTKEDSETYVTDDFQVDNVIVLGSPQNQRDDSVKRFRVVEVDDSRLKTRTGRLPAIANSSLKNPDTMLKTSANGGCWRVPVQLAEDVIAQLDQIRDAYIDHAGGGVPEIGIKAMGRPFRQVAVDGRRYMTREGVKALVRDSRAYGTTTSFSGTQTTRDSIDAVARHIYEAFPREPEGGVGGVGGIDYDVFIDYMRGPMNNVRKNQVWSVFSTLDYDNDGALKIHDVQSIFNAQMHPLVVSDGIFSSDKLLKGFLAIWDENNKNYGVITYPEFLDYYSGLSAVIEDDAVFASILKSSWKLPLWQATSKLSRVA